MSPACLGGSSVSRGMPADRVLLYAPNVHTGGGLVLLQALLDAWPEQQVLRAWLDERARARLRVPAMSQVRWVRATVPSRLGAEISLARTAVSGDGVLCFHGLPPLLPNRGSLQVFLQNRLYLGATPLSAFSWRTRLRVRYEQAVGRGRRHAVDRYWVQTASMARELQAWWGAHQLAPVRVLPFVPAWPPLPARGSPRWDFVYVADGEAHKNHRRLVEAWVLLAQQGLRPTLALTLSPRDAALDDWIQEQVSQHGLAIRNLGSMSHAEVQALYAASGALMFPSLSESYGLPLIEARRQGLPILAPELDYVRDVCEPVQTFDAGSAVSIARAVRRQLERPEAPADPATAAQFLRALVDRST